MNNETKEILEYFKKYVNDKYETYTVVDKYTNYLGILLDYITNLQEENEHLDKVNCQLRKKINNDIYKSRIDKAIDYCKSSSLIIKSEYFSNVLKILEGNEDNE